MMCGILATWDPFDQFGKNIEKAVSNLTHRGPDAQNIMRLDNRKVTLAHTRLKIIDLSNNANQPFVSPSGRWILTYNGEIYNFKALRKEIGDRWIWKTTSDTEVLLAAWSIWREECLNKLLGMFAFIILDNKSKTLILVRDRFGVKPLYKMIQKDFMAFSSEIPPLLNFDKSISANKNTIRTYLENGNYDHCEQTFFNKIKSVRPGTITKINLHKNEEKINKWYDFHRNIKSNNIMTEKDIISETERKTLEAISSNLISDVGLGLNVSGGVDSSMLVRMTIDQIGHADLFTQDYPAYSELPWVKKISKGGTLNIEELTFKKINNFLNETVKSQAEPFGGVFVCGYNSIYKSAKHKNIKVLLDGNGVDETFLGYEKYHQLYLYSNKGKKNYEKIKKDFINFWGYEPKPFKLTSSIDGSNGLMPCAIHRNILREEPTISSNFNMINDPVRELAANDLLYNKIPRGLRFNDRVSMYHSCELRVPFLDHRLVEFAFSIPTNLLLNKMGSKVIFRKVLAKKTSRELAFSRKRSVQSPQREWLSREWRSFVENILNSESFADRKWVDPVIAKNVYSEYINGEMKNSFFIWQWINLELWARHFLDRNVLN